MNWLRRFVIGAAIAAAVSGPCQWEFGNRAFAEPCDGVSEYPGVCLDPGHGGPGACKWSPPCVNGDGEGTCGYPPGMDTCVTEAWANHEIVPLAKTALEAERFYVKCTRTSITQPMTLVRRCDIANAEIGVDLFVSVHHEGDPLVHDTRVYYDGEGKNPEWSHKLALALADGIDEQYHYGKQAIDESKFVLYNTNMPSALTEAYCMTHPEKAELVAFSPEYRGAEATGIKNGVLGYEWATTPLYLTCVKWGVPPSVRLTFEWWSVPGADGYILYQQEDVPLPMCPPTEPTMCYEVVGATSYDVYLWGPEPVFAVRAYREGPSGRYYVGGFSDCIGWWSPYTNCFETAIDRMISSFTATGGDHQVTLSWHAVSFEEWVEFEIWRSTNGGWSYDDSVGCVDYDSNQDDYTFVDMTTGYRMTYYYKIRDTEGYAWWGPASASPVSGVVTPPPPSPTPVLAIDHLGDRHVYLCLEQGSQYADFYNLWWQPDGGAWEDTIHGGERCIEFSELQNGTPYCFVAQAQNQAGTTELSSLVWAVPMASPTNLHDVAGHQCINLWWDGSPAASGYRVYYSTSESDPFQYSADVGDTTATTLTGVENGTLYFVCVVAYDQFANETAPSNLVSSRPQCWAGITDARGVLTEFNLGRSYPNPFESSTVISYQLPEPCTKVRLVVYDTMGREVRRIVNEGQPAGNYEVGWDGRDHAGRVVPPGVYFYRLDAGGFSETEKMLLVR